jgi:hypothetical protein
MFKTTRSLAAAGATLFLAVVTIALMFSTGASSETKEFSRFVDANGGIRLPEDFRKNMVHLGSWFVPKGDASGFHDVYTEASTVEAYRKTGEFPDGATLVKELRASTAGTYTTGPNVSFANDTLKQWFVLIKDRQGRFPDNANWGDGWGWALIKPDDPSANTATNYQASCLGCHIPAKAKDWVYVEAYPTLKR